MLYLNSLNVKWLDLILLVVILLLGLVELEVSYRWFRTCKDAEDWCMRKGAGA